MAQGRYWNFKNDDATYDLTQWLTGILAPGVYHGFDFNPTHNMNLNLNHNTTGFKDVNETPAESNFKSLAITRQGTIVKNDNALTINGIGNGDATHPRIDVVIMTHQYTEILGGTTASYTVIPGTPAASPVAPALTNPLTQIKIGELYIPAGTTFLDGVGVVWTRALPPYFAGLTDTTIGNRVYSEENFITSGQSVTASLDALDIALNDEVLNRIDADTTLAMNISDEIDDRIAGDLALQTQHDTENPGSLIKTIVNIGVWNMDTTVNTDVSLGIAIAKIRGITVLIVNDAGTVLSSENLGGPGGVSAGQLGWVITTVTSLVKLRLGRLAAGDYDDPSYGSGGGNRGWIIVEHIA